MGIHDGHRERLRARFVEHGLDNFNELNALELLLFYAIPRKDTNVIAHELLERFGTLSGVFDAGVRELIEVKDVGYNTAVLLKLIPEIMRKSLISKEEAFPEIRNSKQAGAFLIPRFRYQKDEFILVLCLDVHKRLISCTEIGRGVVNSVDVNVRRIAEIALKNRASSVIVAHNHPGGCPIPSKEDDYTTQMIYRALEAIQIPLADHIIVANDHIGSYADTGLFHLFARK